MQTREIKPHSKRLETVQRDTIGMKFMHVLSDFPIVRNGVLKRMQEKSGLENMQIFLTVI